MNTTSWTVAPTGYLDGGGLGVPPMAPVRCSGLPVPGTDLPAAVIGVQVRTAAPGIHTTTTTLTRFNGTTLGIPSSRRPLS